MIECKTGDLLAEEVEALVNTVNCVGHMGRGIALQFKKAWPENFAFYAAACRRGEVEPGRVLVFETGRHTPPRYIINFPTKRHWRSRSRIEDIEAGLEALVAEIGARAIRSIALPPLGAGLGRLSWSEVRARIDRVLGELPGVRIVLFEPRGAPVAGKGGRASKAPSMTPGRAALIGLMDRYLRGLLDPSISLLEVHKLMYFMQEAGEPLRLRIVKAPYGPYAENLRHVLNAIEGHFISGFGTSGGDDRSKILELEPNAVELAAAELASCPGTRERFDRVAGLVDGFESPFGLELLATVHWVASREAAATEAAVIEKAYGWGEEKRKFTERQIGLARTVLLDRGWIEADGGEGGP